MNLLCRDYLGDRLLFTETKVDPRIWRQYIDDEKSNLDEKAESIEKIVDGSDKNTSPQNNQVSNAVQAEILVPLAIESLPRTRIAEEITYLEQAIRDRIEYLDSFQILS